MHGQEWGKMEFMAQTLSSGFCSEERPHKCELITSIKAPGKGYNWVNLVATWCCPRYFQNKPRNSPFKPLVWFEGGRKGKLEMSVANRIPCLKILWDRHSACLVGSEVAMGVRGCVGDERQHGSLVRKDKPWPNCSIPYAVSSILS